MKKNDAIEIIFSKDKSNKAMSAVFINESSLAIGGQGKCFITNLETQKYRNIKSLEDEEEVYNLCVNKDKTLLGFNTCRRPYLYNIQKNVTNSPSLIHYCGYTSSLGFNTENELTIYHQGNFTHCNEQLNTETGLFFGGSISCYFRENIFLCSAGNSLIEYWDCKSMHSKAIPIPISCSAFFCSAIFCSPQSNFIAIKSRKNKIYIINIEKISSENNFTATPAWVSQTNYFTAAFYPKKQFLALLTINGLLEYRDYSQPNQVIKTQQVINENLNGWSYSIHFSPKGTKVAVIINGKCMLLDVPLDIQYRNGWLIYLCFNKQNMPKEIFLIIIDLMDSLNVT